MDKFIKMYYFATFAVSFICVVTAQGCFKDRASPVTIQNYDGPIYVSPCNQISDNRCSQLYHIAGNPNCDCDCNCVSKNIPPVLCLQPCVSTPQVPCGQPCVSTPQVPCGQPCVCTPQVPCLQPTCIPTGTQVPCSSGSGCTGGSLQGCVSYTWQGPSTPGYYQSCPDCSGWQYKGNDWGSFPVAKCANQFCQCGMKRSGYY